MKNQLPAAALVATLFALPTVALGLEHAPSAADTAPPIRALPSAARPKGGIPDTRGAVGWLKAGDGAKRRSKAERAARRAARRNRARNRR